MVDFFNPIYPTTLNPPDPDSDGLCKDLNGNTRKDFNDVVLMADPMQWITVHATVGEFDFNINGRIVFNDSVNQLRAIFPLFYFLFIILRSFA